MHTAQRASWRHVRLGVLLLAGTVLAGALGFVLVEGFTPLEALYMAVITISTVGFGEIHPLSPAGRVLVIVLIVLGLGLATYTLGSLGGLLLEGHVRRILGRRMMQRGIDALRDHYIVCGYGRMGQTIARELVREQRPHVIVTSDQQQVDELLDEGRYAVYGDATEDATLLAAGVTRARGLVAVVSSDVDNLYITLSARELTRRENPDLYILTRATEETVIRKLRRAGADRVLSPYEIGGRRLAQALLRPTVFDYMEVLFHDPQSDLVLEEFKVPAGCHLTDRAIRDTNLRRDYDLIIIGLLDAEGRMIFNPRPEHVIHEGDTLIILGRRDQAERLGSSLQD